MVSDSPALRPQTTSRTAAAVFKEITCPKNFCADGRVLPAAEQSDRLERAKREELPAERAARKLLRAARVHGCNQRNARKGCCLYSLEIVFPPSSSHRMYSGERQRSAWESPSRFG